MNKNQSIIDIHVASDHLLISVVYKGIHLDPQTGQIQDKEYELRLDLQQAETFLNKFSQALEILKKGG